MNITSEELYQQALIEIKRLNNEYDTLLQEDIENKTKITDTVNCMLGDCAMWEKYGEDYGIVVRFYNITIDKIYAAIPNIVTKLTMRLIEKAITRGANIYNNYYSLEKLVHLNKKILRVDSDIKRYMGEDIFMNLTLFQRIIMNEINDFERNVETF